MVITGSGVEQEGRERAVRPASRGEGAWTAPAKTRVEGLRDPDGRFNHRDPWHLRFPEAEQASGLGSCQTSPDSD